MQPNMSVYRSYVSCEFCYVQIRNNGFAIIDRFILYCVLFLVYCS